MAPFLIWSYPSYILVLFAVLIYSLFLVLKVYILFLVPFCSNLAPFIVCFYSIFSSWGFSSILNSNSVYSLVNIFKFLLRKKGLYGLDIILVTQLIEV